MITTKKDDIHFITVDEDTIVKIESLFDNIGADSETFSLNKTVAFHDSSEINVENQFGVGKLDRNQVSETILAHEYIRSKKVMQFSIRLYGAKKGHSYQVSVDIYDKIRSVDGVVKYRVTSSDIKHVNEIYESISDIFRQCEPVEWSRLSRILRNMPDGLSFLAWLVVWIVIAILFIVLAIVATSSFPKRITVDILPLAVGLAVPATMSLHSLLNASTSDIEIKLGPERMRGERRSRGLVSWFGVALIVALIGALVDAFFKHLF